MGCLFCIFGIVDFHLSAMRCRLSASLRNRKGISAGISQYDLLRNRQNDAEILGVQPDSPYCVVARLKVKKSGWCYSSGLLATTSGEGREMGPVLQFSLKSHSTASAVSGFENR